MNRGGSEYTPAAVLCLPDAVRFLFSFKEDPDYLTCISLLS